MAKLCGIKASTNMGPVERTEPVKGGLLIGPNFCNEAELSPLKIEESF